MCRLSCALLTAWGLLKPLRMLLVCFSLSGEPSSSPQFRKMGATRLSTQGLPVKKRIRLVRACELCPGCLPGPALMSTCCLLQFLSLDDFPDSRANVDLKNDQTSSVSVLALVRWGEQS